MSPRLLARPAFWLVLTALATASQAAPKPHDTQAKPVFNRPDPGIHPDDPQCTDNNGNLVNCNTLSDVMYYGHRVVSNPLIWVIFWTGNVDSATQQQIGTFYESVTNSEMFDWLVEYNTNFTNANGTNQLMGRGVYAGSYTITPTTTSSTSVSDYDIQSELTAQMNANQLPRPDDNSIFMVYFPAGYTVSESNGDASCVKFCAYHGTFLYGSQDVFYGVFPDLGSGGCPGGCGAQSTVFKNLCSASTHELIETVTDAEVGLYDLFHLESSFAWDAQPNGNEVGDMCNQFTSTITSIVDGQPYTVQQEFSQNTRQCVTSYDFLPDDYKFYVNPSLVILAPGTSGAVPVTQEIKQGNPPAHPLSLSGSLAGVTASFDKTTLSGDDSTYLRFAVASNATINSETMYTLTATDPTQASYITTRTAAVMVRVEPAPTALSLTGVTNGGKVNGTVSLRGTASPAANLSLYFVGLYIDGNLVASGSSVATYSWNTSGLAGGSQHSVILFAEDYDGGNAQIQDNVTVQGVPTVHITSPAGGAVTGLVSLSATGTAAPVGAIAHLTLSIDGTQVATSTTSPVAFSWNTTLATNGAHSITAAISDTDGTTASATPVAVTVHNLPTVSITPATGPVSGTVALSVQAAPTHGGALATLALSIDGTQVASGTSSPLAFNWNTSALASGSSHTLLATASDADGAAATATEMLAVQSGPEVQITSPASGATVTGLVSLSASGTPAQGGAIAHLSLSVDGTQVATSATSPVTVSWNSALASNGAHSVSATIADADGATSSATPVSITVHNLPTVTLSPSVTTVSGTVALSVSAVPTPGGALSMVALSIDGTQVASGSTSPLAFRWSTSALAMGSMHTLLATATDADGSSATATETVKVGSATTGANGFALSLDPETATLFIGGASVIFNLTTTATGTPEPIALSVAGLPADVTSSFSPATVTAGQLATLTLTAPAGTSPANSTTFSVGGTSASVPRGHSTTATITVESSPSSGCSTFGGWEMGALAGLLPLLRRRWARLAN